MRIAVSASCIAIAVSIALFLPGCVERKERLTISPEGKVLYQVTYRSDSLDDLFEGDAVPRLADGWFVEQREEKDKEGRSIFTLVAETVFPANLPLPSSFVQSQTEADVCLQFPTELKIERRPDGTYYHFSRTYLARPWAAVSELRERMIEAPLSSLEGFELEEWTPAERMMAVRAIANFEVEKAILFARHAFKATADDAPQDLWLAMRDDMYALLNELDYAKLAKLLEPPKSAADRAQHGQKIETETKALKDAISQRLKLAARDIAGFGGAQLSRFMAEYDRLQKQLEVTEDLADDKFIIEVEMPGQIIASNASAVTNRVATWNFDGDKMRDREIELLVTSRVAQ